MTELNSIGMEMIAVPAGSFIMGDNGGDFDERPAHKVAITQGFLMGATPVTNAQYELFDPGHKAFRGKRGLSAADDEAVIFISWHDAVAFCKWLSEKEGKPYRLPTEAEWEYACRSGTKTAYHTGDELPAEYHRHQEFDWNPHAVPLAVCKTPANAWGLRDMHGLVEEWCADWYGPYEGDNASDPVGRGSGEFRVTRGGSHNTLPEYLRSAARSAMLPEDKHWMTGFRVVQGPMPASKPLPAPKPTPCYSDISDEPHDWKPPTDMDKPFFAEPKPYVFVPADANGPLYVKHNHQPSITWCDNGDLLAVFFTTNTERGRELAVAASRLRKGSDQWDPASIFYKVPDRNMTGSAVFNDGKGTLFHFNGVEVAGGWENLALLMRTSRDNGATWKARLIDPEHHRGNQVISGTSLTKEGYLLQPCDAVHGGNGGSFLHVSRDGGETWEPTPDPMPDPVFAKGASGRVIAGIHAGVAQLADGSLLALGRGDEIEDSLAMSLSTDMGRSWTYRPSEFPPINGGQRLVLMRLNEGPLLCVTFTDTRKWRDDPKWPWVRGIRVRDAAGKERTIFGMFAALSFDEGKTWTVKKPLTAGGLARKLNGGGWTREFTTDDEHAEPAGYLAATQSPDGVIHLLSSALHYRFNLAWLKEPMAPES